jgi:hypothetical protein
MPQSTAVKRGGVQTPSKYERASLKFPRHYQPASDAAVIPLPGRAFFGARLGLSRRCGRHPFDRDIRHRSFPLNPLASIVRRGAELNGGSAMVGSRNTNERRQILVIAAGFDPGQELVERQVKRPRCGAAYRPPPSLWPWSPSLKPERRSMPKIRRYGFTVTFEGIEYFVTVNPRATSHRRR